MVCGVGNMMRQIRKLTIGWVLVCGTWASEAVHAQLRSDLIESARSEKEANLTPETPPKAERKIVWVENSLIYKLLTGQVDGFGVGFGQLVPGAGFALGPQYKRTDLWGGRLTL